MRLMEMSKQSLYEEQQAARQGRVGIGESEGGMKEEKGVERRKCGEGKHRVEVEGMKEEAEGGIRCF